MINLLRILRCFCLLSWENLYLHAGLWFLAFMHAAASPRIFEWGGGGVGAMTTSLPTNLTPPPRPHDLKACLPTYPPNILFLLSFRLLSLGNTPPTYISILFSNKKKKKKCDISAEGWG